MSLPNRRATWPEQWDKLAAFGFGVAFIIVMLVVSLAVPTPTETQWFVFRVILASAAAGFGAVVPGLIIVRVSGYIRAGGAMALFVLVYWFNPPKLISVPQRQTVNEQHTAGAASPIVSGSGNTVTIDSSRVSSQNPAKQQEHPKK